MASSMLHPFLFATKSLMPAFIPVTAESWSRAQVQSLQSLKSLGKCSGEGEMLNKNYPKIHLPSDTKSHCLLFFLDDSPCKFSKVKPYLAMR